MTTGGMHLLYLTHGTCACLCVAPRTQVEQKLAEAMVEGPFLPPKSGPSQSEDVTLTEELDSDGEEEGQGSWVRMEEGSIDMASSSGSSSAEKQVRMVDRMGEWEGQGKVGGARLGEWERQGEESGRGKARKVGGARQGGRGKARRVGGAGSGGRDV